MKKLKFLPSILMLTLCIAILGVGVFAIAPTQNTISGSVTINASNSPVEIDLLIDGVQQQGYPKTVRSGLNMDIDTSLLFDGSVANSAIEVPNHVITIKVQNKSADALGVYFYQDGENDTYASTEDGIGANYAKAGNIQTEAVVFSNADGDIIKATLTPYLYCAPENTTNSFDIAEMNIRFSMENLSSTQENNKPFSFDLRIEPYVANVTTTELYQTNATYDEETQEWTVPENRLNKKFVKLPNISTYSTIGEGQFYDDTTLEYLVIPNNVTGFSSGYNSVTDDSYYCSFSGATAIKSISLCASVSIYRCYGVMTSVLGFASGTNTNLYVNGVSTLDDSAFDGWFNIVELSSSVTQISSSPDYENLDEETINQWYNPYLAAKILVMPEITSLGEYTDIYVKDKLIVKTKQDVANVSYTLPTSATGYSFEGWSYAGANGTTVDATEDLPNNVFERVYYSIKTPITYTITLNANGGTVSASDGWTQATESTVTKSIAYDSAYGTLPTPTKSGYDFVGWFTAQTGGTQITAEKIMTYTANRTIYAKWE